MAAGPPLVSDTRALGFSLGLQIKAQIGTTASHTCPSTQLRVPPRAGIYTVREGEGFSLNNLTIIKSL